MYVYSSTIEVPAGSTLSGFGTQSAHPTSECGVLEVHGIGCTNSPGWEICSVDSLYAGALMANQPEGHQRRIIAASHTHFAPMLDALKPALGIYSPQTVNEFMRAIETAQKHTVSPTICTIFRGDVDIPVYRRFDFPGSKLDRLLTRYAGLYPNEDHPVDKGVYLFVFSCGDTALFAFAYHACHPVTRHSGAAASADYVHALREGVKERFGTAHCLFFLGCAGDIRPNFAEKRIAWLPRNRLNWRFRSSLTINDQEMVDRQYRDSVLNSLVVGSFPVSETAFKVSSQRVSIRGAGVVDMPQLCISDRVKFSFFPFEVSHRYHLEALGDGNMPFRFIVSCAGNTRGYLPHPDQHKFGGYEVDGSRRTMGIEARLGMGAPGGW